MEDAERLFIEDFDTWDMTGYYLYSKLLRSAVSAHIGTWGWELRFEGVLCLICDQLRLGVPGLCLGVPGKGSARRCKWLIYKPLEHPAAG